MLDYGFIYLFIFGKQAMKSTYSCAGPLGIEFD